MSPGLTFDGNDDRTFSSSDHYLHLPLNAGLCGEVKDTSDRSLFIFVFNHRLTLVSRHADIFDVTYSPLVKKTGADSSTGLLLGLTDSGRLTGLFESPLVLLFHNCSRLPLVASRGIARKQSQNKLTFLRLFPTYHFLPRLPSHHRHIGRILASQPLSRRIYRVIRRNLTLE